MSSTRRIINCSHCGCERWAGLGPCGVCGLRTPEYEAETARINIARREAGLLPLDESDGDLK